VIAGGVNDAETAFTSVAARRFASPSCRQLKALSSRFSDAGCPASEGIRLSGERVITRVDSFQSTSPSSPLGRTPKAGTLEKESFQVHEIGARVAAEVTDSRLRRNKEIALAVWAAHAACAINTGSEYATKEIWEMVEEKLPKQLLYDFPGKPEPLAIATIREMLSSPT
jgi:hypothetical protein